MYWSESSLEKIMALFSHTFEDLAFGVSGTHQLVSQALGAVGLDAAAGGQALQPDRGGAATGIPRLAIGVQRSDLGFTSPGSWIQTYRSRTSLTVVNCLCSS